MAERKYNIALKIGTLIPGFNGYLERSDRRKSEKIFRDQNATLLEQTEKAIIIHQKSLLAPEYFESLQQWEMVRKAMNTIIPKFRHAAYGVSSFFSKEKIKEGELDEILKYDEEIVTRIQLIHKASENEFNEVLSAQLIIQNLQEIENLLLQRSAFIAKYK